MQRLRSVRDELPTPSDQPPSKTRADSLSAAADAAKRGADAYLDREQGRSRGLAAVTAASGALSMALAGTAALGYGNPHVIGLLAALAALAPTASALSHAAEGDPRLREAAVDRGFCQAVSTHSRRLGDSIGATDERNIPLSSEVIINSQIDVLYKDLDRSKQRLAARGADMGQTGKVNRLNERIVPDQAETAIVTPDGRRYPVWIAELSQTAVTLRGSLPPLSASESIKVGSRTAKLASTSAGRATYTFSTPIVLSEFTRKIVL